MVNNNKQTNNKRAGRIIRGGFNSDYISTFILLFFGFHFFLFKNFVGVEQVADFDL